MRKILGSFVVLALLTACGRNDDSPSLASLVTSTTVIAQSDKSISNPPTTVPLISKSSLPKSVICPTQQISKDTGETFRENIRCVNGWAAGIPQRFVDKFSGDTDVEAEWIMTKRASGWVVVGVCHVYYPIYESGSTCNNPYSDDPVDASLIPPMPVQCALWDGARFKDSIAETGCPNSF